MNGVHEDTLTLRKGKHNLLLLITDIFYQSSAPGTYEKSVRSACSELYAAL